MFPAAERLAELPAVAAAFSDYVHRHQRTLWRYLRLIGADSSEVDGLVQDTFLRVPLTAIEAPDSGLVLLRRVARQVLIDARRAARRRLPAQEWSDAVDALVVQEPSILSDERVDALRACVGRLGPRARAAVEGHYFAGQDYRALEAEMGLTRSGLKTLLARARRALRECITNEVAER